MHLNLHLVIEEHNAICSLVIFTKHITIETKNKQTTSLLEIRQTGHLTSGKAHQSHNTISTRIYSYNTIIEIDFLSGIGIISLKSFDKVKLFLLMKNFSWHSIDY